MKICPGILAALLLASTVAAQTPQPQAPPAQTPQTQPSPAPATPPAPRAARPARTPASSPVLTVEVTSRDGSPVADVQVEAAGPVDRSGVTAATGAVTFRSMRPGTYRLRFEHERFITLEREVTIRAGQPATAAVALTPAPPAPAPVAAPEPAAPPPPPQAPARAVEPRFISIPDFLDKNLIGGVPQKTTLIACAEGGTARLLQVRDPLTDQEHPDVDELIYVVAGAGVLRIRNQETKLEPGFFALVPRGIGHSLRRSGRNPLIVVAVLAGAPCTDDAVPGR